MLPGQAPDLDDDGLAPSEPTPPTPAAPAPPPSLGLTPESVRNSPEYRELLAQNRSLARQKGSAEAAAAAARAEAETARQAAEATQQAALDAQLRDRLGDEGLAFWSEFSELSQTDPVAAADRLAAFRASGGQTPAAGAPNPGQPAPTTQGGTVSAQGAGAPPPMASGIVADSPLGQFASADSDETVMNALQKRADDIAARNQDPITRNRVTEKERSEGIMAIFAKGVVSQLSARARGNR